MELEVADQCVAYLSSIRSYEKLPHTAVSMGVVRRVYANMRGKTNPGTSDPNLISGVLQCALKDLKPCLLSAIYDDLILFGTTLYRIRSYILNYTNVFIRWYR